MLIVQNVLPDGNLENRWTENTGFDLYKWNIAALKRNKTSRRLDENVKYAEQLTAFSTKEEYLEWVKQWKFEHASLARRQRILRVALTQPHLQAESLRWDGIKRQAVPCMVTDSSVSKLQTEKDTRRKQLDALYHLRKYAKQKSWKQKLASSALETQSIAS